MVCGYQINATNLNNWQKFDMRHRPKRENYPRGVYGDIDYQERLERYCTYLENKNKALTEQCNIHGVMQSAFAVIPDAERYLGGTNEVISVFKHREQAERFAKTLWEQYYIIEEIQSPHFA